MASVSQTNTAPQYANEIISYEMLWADRDLTPSKLTALFSDNALPSQLIHNELHNTSQHIEQLRQEIANYMAPKLDSLDVNINDKAQYPQCLQDPSAPLKFLYYRGDINLLNEPNKLIGISGSRKATKDGISRAFKLARSLTDAGFTIVSGLAHGIDTAAHISAIKNGGKTIAVLGTPIDQYYPKKNKELQDEIARDHLLISHVPFYKYQQEPFQYRKFYFPQRNKVIASISSAVVIVEAANSSGSIIQARETLKQGKKLFILDSCFLNEENTWQYDLTKRGGGDVIRVKELSDITKNL